MSEVNPVAYRYEYTCDGQKYVDYSTYRFHDSWIESHAAKVTPLYTRAELGGLSDIQWRELLGVMFVASKDKNSCDASIANAARAWARENGL